MFSIYHQICKIAELIGLIVPLRAPDTHQTNHRRRPTIFFRPRHAHAHIHTRTPIHALLARAYIDSRKTLINSNNACSGVSQPKQTRLFYTYVFATVIK